MSCIVYQRSKNGSVYAYRSESYRSPKTGRPTSRREYLGRVDPETGEIVPKRPRRGGAAGTAEPEARPATEAADARAAAAEAGDVGPGASVEELVGALSELRATIASLDGAIARALDAIAAGAE